MIASAIQVCASLVAVALLGLLAHLLGLGGDRRIRDEAEARRLADEAICGFDPVEVGIDRAARLLDRRSSIRLDRHFLTIAPSDRRFGAVTLDLGKQAQTWAASFRRLDA